MIWDQLLGNIREGLRESGSHLRVAGELVADVAEEDCIFNDVQIALVLASLTLATSNVHSVVEHLGIGLDAVVETLREANQSQEVSGE